LARASARSARFLLSNWPVEAREVRRYGDVFSVRTRDGRFALKPVDKHRRRARFVCSLTEYLAGRDDPLTPPLQRTRLGAFMVSEHPARHWIMCQWVHGRVSDWDHLDDALRCTDALARFHLAARGYRHRPNERPKAYWGVWPEKLAGRKEAMKACFALAAERTAGGAGTRFDKLAAEIASGQLAYAAESLKVLAKSEYPHLCDRYRALGQVIHGDPAGRNFVCTEYGTVRIIDLETVRQDLPAADVAKLLRRVLKKHRWDLGVARTVLARYQAVLPLEGEVLPLIFAFVVFPTKIFRDLRRYYEHKSGWSSSRHLHKLRKHLREERDKPAFIGKFRELCLPAELRAELE